MNFISRICVPSTLRVITKHTEVFIVRLDLTPNISKDATFHNCSQSS